MEALINLRKSRRNRCSLTAPIKRRFPDEMEQWVNLKAYGLVSEHLRFNERG